METTTSGRVERARHLAREDDLVAALVGMARQGRREQCLGIGVLRRARQGAGIAALDDQAEIHDHDRVAHMRDRGEIVGDEEVGETEFGLQVAQQV